MKYIGFVDLSVVMYLLAFLDFTFDLRQILHHSYHPGPVHEKIYILLTKIYCLLVPFIYVFNKYKNINIIIIVITLIKR